MIPTAIVITLLYVLAMLFLLYGTYQLPVLSGKNAVPKTTFSIVIPLRNEAENLPALLDSLLKLNYPIEKYEILLINDASEDASEAICEDFRRKHPELKLQLLQNIRKSGSPKKDAIKTAIKVAKMDYILTTDADCIVPEGWLHEFNGLITEKEADAVAGPVMLKRGVSKMGYWRRFQEMDFFSLQAATLGGFGVRIPFMCNGANFCYSKKAFLNADGFEGNSAIASGDDVFLLEKFQKMGLKIAFLKSPGAVVATSPASGVGQMLSQRIRWAGKTSATKNSFGKAVGLIVFLMNFLLSAAFIAMIFGIFSHTVFLGMFLFKFNVDFLLIHRAASFFGRESSLKSYFWSSMIYPFFSSSVVILSIFSEYEWKGRRFKK
ncbi:MAG: glycosyltransferase [Salinimicrobium sediminis]|nr:glycosyltransferase [Salinimicrobium sediminis]